MIVKIINNENNKNSVQISYYIVQRTIETKKHILKVGNTAEADCHREKCENVELPLVSVKNALKQSHPDHPLSLFIPKHLSHS